MFFNGKIFQGSTRKTVVTRTSSERQNDIPTMVTETGDLFGRAGLNINDIIAAVNGIEVEGATHAAELITGTAAGSYVSLLVERSIYAEAALPVAEINADSQQQRSSPGWFQRKKATKQEGAFVDVIPMQM